MSTIYTHRKAQYRPGPVGDFPVLLLGRQPSCEEKTDLVMGLQLLPTVTRYGVLACIPATKVMFVDVGP